jgi:hypothetical protein
MSPQASSKPIAELSTTHMTKLNFFRFAIYTPIALLLGCGGGGGGGTTTGGVTPLPQSTQMSALVAPSQWPGNFKPSVTIAKSALISSAELSNSPNASSEIFMQVWYLNQKQERVDIANLTLTQLDQMGGAITFTRVPLSVALLKSEIYTAKDGIQLTLSTRDISI